MIKTIKILLVAVIGMSIGCSSKTVTSTPSGDRSVYTVTDASKFTDAQAIIWEEYYKSIANPPVIATITQPDGTVIAINSQVPPPTPSIRQYENQYVKPITGLLKTGVQIIGGGWVAREIVRELQGINITNTGSGAVTVDKSENVEVETTDISGSSTVKTNSENPTTDNHIEKADPIIVEQESITVVEPSVITVEPKVVVVDPSYPPTD